ncbi:MAG: prepilin-type N-terminal cleavage/methylation domain-containing protein [Proteobacteria bacterium]|nr:MAG: prepilin-type N-terminal cleavage/methylation domain-containing protein [Pseudomonadota bacterium]
MNGPCEPTRRSVEFNTIPESTTYVTGGLPATQGVVAPGRTPQFETNASFNATPAVRSPWPRARKFDRTWYLIPRCRVDGFTLIELAIAVVIVGVLAGFAFPAFQRFSASNTVRQGIDDLTNGFLTARTMAVTDGRPVTICALDGDSCSGDPADWTQAWASFKDCDGDGTIDPGTCDGGPEPVYARSDGNNANWTAVDDNGNAAPATFVFLSSGMISVPASEDWPVRFALSAKHGTYTSTVFVNQLGRICVEIRQGGNCG